jgi:uncharacterized damage-inducible protein DinB
MRRKEALQKMAGGLLITAGPLTEVHILSANDAFLQDFLPRWQNALAYSLKVLDKMPAELYGYKPTPAQMTFGKQYTHAAHWNTFFIGNIVNQPPLPEPAQADKAKVKEYYTTCHHHCTAILEKLDTLQLDNTGYGTHDYWKKHTGRDYLLRAFMHITHHRAETLVYLRLNGIEPPFFEF